VLLSCAPPAVGKTIVAEAVHILRVVDGKLAEHWAVRDDLGVLRQLDTLDGAPQAVRSRPTL
jgi:hypothetical protein